MSQSARGKATLVDFWAIPEARRFHELIGGELIEKRRRAASTAMRRRASSEPSGARSIAVQDVAAPDWICEVISPGHATEDTVKKLRLYHRAGIAHYWLADPGDATLTVMRWSADGYVMRLRAERGEVVRAEPFEAIEIAVGTLFGDDPPG